MKQSKFISFIWLFFLWAGCRPDESIGPSIEPLGYFTVYGETHELHQGVTDLDNQTLGLEQETRFHIWFASKGIELDLNKLGSIGSFSGVVSGKGSIVWLRFRSKIGYAEFEGNYPIVNWQGDDNQLIQGIPLSDGVGLGGSPNYDESQPGFVFQFKSGRVFISKGETINGVQSYNVQIHSDARDWNNWPGPWGFDLTFEGLVLKQ